MGRRDVPAGRQGPARGPDDHVHGDGVVTPGLDRTTIRYSIPEQGGPPTSSWYLIVSVGDASSRIVPIADPGELVFGRAPNCEVVLDQEGVSRRHARVLRRGDQITIEDLDSRNGTLVNGKKSSGTRRLAAGDQITMGPAIAVVATSSPPHRKRQVATAGELDDRLDGEVDRASRYRRPLGLLMLRLEGPTDDVMEHVDRLLATLRRMDFVAEYSGEELALVLPEAGPEAVGVVARRATSTSGPITCAAGASVFPEDGAHAGELITVARERLRGARAFKRGRTVPPPDAREGPIVVDPLMKHAFQLATRAGGSTITVLVTGETGTGKELIAEAVHRGSPRAKKPMVKINCAALPDTLIESELFGHERGAFTGAIAEKAGIFETAHGGTLLLDEIGELPLSAQAKLLRVLEHRTLIRVGGTRELPVDVRLVCATHRNLDEEVERGRFREDLFFRISAFVIPVPPLRDRRAEVGPLAQRFLREIARDLGDRALTLTPEAAAALTGYEWPGNVRELRNVIERAVVLASGREIEVGDLPDRIRTRAGKPAPSAFDMEKRVADVEREVVVAALAACRGNQTHAAKKLGISRFALIRLMDKLEIKRSR